MERDLQIQHRRRAQKERQEEETAETLRIARDQQVAIAKRDAARQAKIEAERKHWQDMNILKAQREADKVFFYSDSLPYKHARTHFATWISD